MNVQIDLLRETKDGAVYRAVLTGPGAPAEPLEFSVSSSGALAFDNRQPHARACAGRAASLALAEAMTRTARSRVPAALSGRTTGGLARELRLHYRAYRLGLFRAQAVTAEMGSPDPAAPDHDHNAALFEHPLRGLPQTLKHLLRRP